MNRNFTVIPDANFSEAMNREVEPYLAGLMRNGYLPVEDTPVSADEGIRSSCREGAPASAGRNAKAGTGLYYEAYEPDNALGAIVISHGFCETIQKYKEVIYYFVRAGYRVYLADHRGHGYSLRETDHPGMVHIRSFSSYVTDLHAFVTRVVQPACKSLPLYLYAHSMGGAIGALYLETYPEIFKKAVLTAPMLSINLGSVPAPAARLLGALCTAAGKGDFFAPGQHGYIPGERFEESGSACPRRFAWYQSKKEKDPLLQLGGSSYSWALQSLRAAGLITRKKSCDKITAPVLVFQAEKDSFVKPEGIRRFTDRTPSSRLLLISGSRHEIYNSPASILQNYYPAIFQFLEEEKQMPPV